VQEPLAQLTVGYPALLEDLKAHIRTAQTRAALMANRELIRLLLGDRPPDRRAAGA
jgi:hypothetical protein